MSEPDDKAADSDAHAILDIEDTSRGPEPRQQRPSTRHEIALCLSGGGFRAALFHLGGLTRLNELGVLAQVGTFSCVSGGSIIGGFLAARIAQGAVPQNGVYRDWDRIAEDFLPFVRRDIRTRSLLAQFAFWRIGVRGARRLQGFYESLTSGLKLSELPSRPRFIYCATDLVYANAWVSERKRVGDYRAGYVTPPPSDWTLGKAVAASSCFPPLFTPLPTDIHGDVYRRPARIDAEHFRSQAKLRGKIRLTDGGVYDNLGIEPVWKNHRTVLVSDGGKPLQYMYVPPGRRLMRYNEVVQNQVNALRKRWLIDTYERAKRTGVDAGTFEGTYWGIGSATSRYHGDVSPGYGYSKELADSLIANIRTDLDPFSPNEIYVLMKHGYELADIAVRTHAPTLIKFPQARRREWPPGLGDESLVANAIRGSARRRYVRISARHHANDLLGGGASLAAIQAVVGERGPRMRLLGDEGQEVGTSF